MTDLNPLMDHALSREYRLCGKALCASRTFYPTVIKGYQ
jgi:hypothetical protein